MRKVLVIALAFLAVAATGYRKFGLFKLPENWPKPVYDFSKNPICAAKVELGRKLFYDPVLSADNSISCATCHSPYNAFAHTDHAVSHGIHDRFGTRNAPALMNLAWQNTFMWDGAIHHLDQQALAPISNPDEMGENIANVVNKLNENADYSKLFSIAFGDSVITGEHTLKAISQFLLTLVSCESKYDSVQLHLTTFNEQESHGELLFMRNCSSCHTPPLFTNNGFENNGLPLDSIHCDNGRSKISGKTEDDRKFKVPTLRNIAYTAPYMHDGRFKRLQQVLNHYTDGIETTGTLSEKLKKKVILSADDKADIIAFLLTLSDRNFLFDERHSFPKELLQQANR